MELLAPAVVNNILAIGLAIWLRGLEIDAVESLFDGAAGFVGRQNNPALCHHRACDASLTHCGSLPNPLLIAGSSIVAALQRSCGGSVLRARRIPNPL